jgi:DNA-directed RNA polymerase specialized sigma24 family protein
LLIDVPDKEIRPEILKLSMADLSEAINKMPEHLQETLSLLLDGKSVSEVAEALSSPNTKIWQRIRRIRIHLKKWAKNNFPDMGELL